MWARSSLFIGQTLLPLLFASSAFGPHTELSNNDNNSQDGYNFLCVANLQFSLKHLKLSGHDLRSCYDGTGGD